MFYDNLISSGTKMNTLSASIDLMFYDNLISSGTKIAKSKKVGLAWVLR